jgi:hypothetical protein
MMKELRPFASASFSLLLAACGGGSEDGGGGAGGAGTAGLSAVSGSSPLGGTGGGGSGGQTPAAGNGSGGSRAGGPTGGHTGVAGSSSVLDPTIPAPSYDCVADSASKACVAARGTFNGAEVDKHCSRPDAPLLLLRNPDAWPAACDERNGTKLGWFFQIAVPVGEPGPFKYEAKAGDDYIGADVVVTSDSYGGDFRASNLLSGAVAGVIEVDAASGEHVAYGTFRADYGPPDVLCNSSFATECAPGRITGTFRVQSPLGNK